MSIINQWKVRLHDSVLSSEKVDAISFAVFNDFLKTTKLTIAEKVQLLGCRDKKRQRLDRFIFNMAGAVGEGDLAITVAQVLNLLINLMSVDMSELHIVTNIFFLQNDSGESLGHKAVNNKEPLVMHQYIAVLQALLAKTSRPATLLALLTLTDKKNKTFAYHLGKRDNHLVASEVLKPLIDNLQTYGEVTSESLTLINAMSQFNNGLAKQLKLSFKETSADVLLQLLCKDYLARSMMKTLTPYQGMVAQHIYTLPDRLLTEIALKSHVLNSAVDPSTLLNAFFSATKESVCFSLNTVNKDVLHELHKYHVTWHDQYPVCNITNNNSPNRTIEAGCQALSPGLIRFEVAAGFYQFPDDLQPQRHDCHD